LQPGTSSNRAAHQLVLKIRRKEGIIGVYPSRQRQGVNHLRHQAIEFPSPPPVPSYIGAASEINKSRQARPRCAVSCYCSPASSGPVSPPPP
jgi:hypothetical protein